MTVSYQVRFSYYQYNQGDSRNGDRLHSIPFPTMEGAAVFAKEVKDNLLNSSKWLHDRFRIDGTAVRFGGVYKITEEKIA